MQPNPYRNEDDYCAILHLLVDISHATLAAVMAIEMVGHESPGTTLCIGALLPEPLNLTGGSAVLELFAGEDEALLVRRDALLVLDLGLDIVDGVGRLNLEGYRLPREGFHEDLHACNTQLSPSPIDDSRGRNSQRKLI
ncbi:hypothetical protein G2W53_020506 [Senna tora]|uniref:Uncharacterized protein n=1 Tax=Senna tora TaxID=362788 RepID=A0A834WNR5_9FABA|nr:hypothetical protein G2W53_020506 [Senna tora]